MPVDRDLSATDIPSTYVPARNTIFLSLALGWAEALGSRDMVIGVNALDYSGYPDCRPEFVQAFETLARVATKAGVEGNRFRIHTPLITMTKADIIRKGLALGLDYALTHSCYSPSATGRPCGHCDSCRAQGERLSRSRRRRSTPVAMTTRLYYDDPYQQTFEAIVTGVTQTEGRIQVVLDRDGFLPDLGWPAVRPGPARTVDCRRRDGPRQRRRGARHRSGRSG